VLFPLAGSPNVPFTSFALFVGVSISVTAFPVLARILTDQRVSKSPLGRLTLGSAALADVAAGCLLALAVATTQQRPDLAVQTVLLTIAYVALMVGVVRPLLGRIVGLLDRRGRLTDGGIAIMALGALLSALTTEVIGIHAIFGAFLLGAIVPKGRIADE